MGGGVARVRRCVLGFFVVAALAPVLSACLRDPYVSANSMVRSGSWRIERQVDRITSAPVDNAVVSSMASNSSVAFPQPALLGLSCFMGKPLVRFAFEFKVGTNLNSFLAYRFDEKPGHEIGGRFLQNSTTVVIEDPAEVAQFVNELASSSVLYVRIRSLNVGRTTAEFKVDGAPAAIESALAGCPVSRHAPPPQASTPQGPPRRATPQSRRPSA